VNWSIELEMRNGREEMRAREDSAEDGNEKCRRRAYTYTR
jgi:hypothetical protein